MMKSWKTSLMGVGSAVVAVWSLVVAPMLDSDPATVANWGAAIAAVVAAVGLLMARDNDKSSENVGAK
jgi:hypothetical protein